MPEFFLFLQQPLTIIPDYNGMIQDKKSRGRFTAPANIRQIRLPSLYPFPSAP